MTIKLEIYSQPDTCPACRRMEKTYDEMSKEFETEFIDISTDEGVERAYDKGIRSMPSVAVMKDGEMVDLITGYMPKDNFRARVYQNL